ncbi:MAG: HD domain-containing protein [Deltaproteobacteria bacterium]|nr:HD domain-containing protein [Candidatus Zymogenaceae bacterium]
MVKISDIIRDEDELLSKKKKSKDTAQKPSDTSKGMEFSTMMNETDMSSTKNGESRNRPFHSDSENEQAEDILSRLHTSLTDMYNQVRNGDAPDFSLMESLTAEFISSMDTFENYYMLRAYADYDYTDLAQSAIWTTLFTTKIATRMGIPEPQKTNCALCGLFHDIGLMLIPDEIVQKTTPLSKSERDLLRSHPKLAYDLVNSADSHYTYLAETIYQEHEFIDGTGYPQGLTGKQIGLYAKIIMVADTYDALTHTRAYHDRKIPLIAIKEIIDTRAKKYDTRVLKAFLEEITLFPVGCYVKLNNHETGRVIGSMGGSHFRHVVEILFDSNGDPLGIPRTLDLMKSPLLYIVEGIDERTLDIEQG